MKNGMVVNCSICNIEFYITPSRFNNKSHTCSIKCRSIKSHNEQSNKIKTNCYICDKEIFYKQSHFKKIKNHCCSRSCSGVMRGKTIKGNSNPRSLNLNETEMIFWNRAYECSYRAKAKNMDYDIDYLFLQELYNKQDGKCFYTNLPMLLNGGTTVINDIFSVDRVDSSKGYTKDNIVLCLTIINRFKADCSVEYINKIFLAIKENMNEINVKIKKLSKNAIVPLYQSTGAAGFDFYAIRDIYIHQGDTVLVETGLSFEIPIGYELQVRPRSGMSAKTKIRVSNSPGTIDCDFRGEVKIILDNIGLTPYFIKTGDRIAQGVLSQVDKAKFEEVEELEQTERGSGAFGSSGV